MPEKKRQSEKANDQQLLSVNDVAKRCGVCTRTVYTWINEERLPVYRIPCKGKRGIIRIAQEDLDEWTGQFRHDFAKEKDKSQRTMRIEGRQFIASENRLDTSRPKGSRVSTWKDGRR
jgi:excisionase family DNA binding protein